jgi:predicted nucleotidyltransferase
MNDPIALIFGTSALRREVLAAFYARPGLVVHPRELARRLGRSPQVVAREMARLEDAGILTSESVGRARRYQVDGASPIAESVRALVVNTIGVEGRLRAALEDVAGIEEAFIFGSYARRTDRADSDVDVLVIGTPDRRLLAERLVEVEQDLGRDVSVSAYRREELDRLRASGDPFLADVLGGPLVPLIASPHSG